VTKPRLLLDVDGVLNAWPFVAQDRENPWNDYQNARVMGFPIWWSPTMVKRLLAVSTRVEVLWLTTWERDAQIKLAPALGLPRWELAGDRDLWPEGPDGWWKLDVARDLYERDPTPFIWIDDDYAFDDLAVRWIKSLPPGVAMAISPDSNYGITDAHLDLIEAFVDDGEATAEID
jgi:HAD domain in Swiss Army Knife RNA repair proteins